MTQPNTDAWADGSSGNTPITAARLTALRDTANAGLNHQLIPTTPAKTAAYTAAYRDLVIVDATNASSGIVITIPACPPGPASTGKAQFISVMRIDTVTANTVTVALTGSDTFFAGGQSGVTSINVIPNEVVSLNGVPGSGVWFRQNAAASAPVTIPTTDVQIFTSSGTWTKPASARTVTAVVLSAGGGGGGGPRTASGTAASGGAGGSSGGFNTMTMPAAGLNATEPITVGAGGTAGAAATANSTSGGNGGNGGNSIFAGVCGALGGAGGAGGSTSAAAGGSTSSIGSIYPYGPGAASVVGGAGLSPAANTIAGGGGSGGGLATTPANLAGGAGQSGYLSNTGSAAAGSTSGTGNGGAGASAGNSNSNQHTDTRFPSQGGGGGGGASRASGTAGAGGNGGQYSGGAGGGGAAVNGYAPGAGGVGGAGLVIVISSP